MHAGFAGGVSIYDVHVEGIEQAQILSIFTKIKFGQRVDGVDLADVI